MMRSPHAKPSLQTRQRFYFLPPFFREDTRINLTQVWDHNPDGTVTFNLLYSFEKDGRLTGREIMEVLYHPLPVARVLEALGALGYTSIRQMPYPATAKQPAEEADWYCVLAEKT